MDNDIFLNYSISNLIEERDREIKREKKRKRKRERVRMYIVSEIFILKTVLNGRF